MLPRRRICLLVSIGLFLYFAVTFLMLTYVVDQHRYRVTQ